MTRRGPGSRRAHGSHGRRASLRTSQTSRAAGSNREPEPPSQRTGLPAPPARGPDEGVGYRLTGPDAVGGVVVPAPPHAWRQAGLRLLDLRLAGAVVYSDPRAHPARGAGAVGPVASSSADLSSGSVTGTR